MRIKKPQPKPIVVKPDIAKETARLSLLALRAR